MSDALQEIKKEAGLRIFQSKAAGVHGGRGEMVLMKAGRRSVRPGTTRQETQEAAPRSPTPSRSLKQGGLGLWCGRWVWAPQGLPVSWSPAS